jgi:hypothetical protein
MVLVVSNISITERTMSMQYLIMCDLFPSYHNEMISVQPIVLVMNILTISFPLSAGSARSGAGEGDVAQRRGTIRSSSGGACCCAGCGLLHHVRRCRPDWPSTSTVLLESPMVCPRCIIKVKRVTTM